MNHKKFTGCDEDCFHCPFPDCYKPARSFKKDKASREALRSDCGDSQSHMYTLGLGGVGKTMPNISKKYYL